jgi:hypothetical protein
MEEGDVLVDGGNEWYPNTIRRAEELKVYVKKKNYHLHYKKSHCSYSVYYVFKHHYGELTQYALACYYTLQLECSIVYIFHDL